MAKASVSVATASTAEITTNGDANPTHSSAVPSTDRPNKDRGATSGDANPIRSSAAPSTDRPSGCAGRTRVACWSAATHTRRVCDPDLFAEALSMAETGAVARRRE